MPCVPTGSLAERLEDARVAFVGLVSSATDEGHTAEVAVEKIWLGERLPENVTVTSKGVPELRTFEEGRRYLFVPTDVSPPFEDDACTATTGYTPAVARLEPDGAIGPAGDSNFAWLGLLLILGAVGWWQARRARHRAAEIDF